MRRCNTHDWLPEVLPERGVPERAEVDPVEVVLVPEVDLVDLLHVERLVREGRHVQVSPRGEHPSARLEPLLGVKVRLQHPLVEQHVAHGLRDDDINLFRQLNLLDLAGDDLDDGAHAIGADQGLGVFGNAKKKCQ